MVIIDILRIFGACIKYSRIVEPFTILKVLKLQYTFSGNRKLNDYSGPDPIIQTNEQLTHTVLLSDEDSATPLTSDYEGLYKFIIDNRTLVVGVYNTSTYNDNSELMMSCVQDQTHVVLLKQVMSCLVR